MEKLIELRNTLIEFTDKFSRTDEPVKTVDPNECEDEEGWEDNEEQEYTIQSMFQEYLPVLLLVLLK